MTTLAENRVVRRELSQLMREGAIDPALYERLSDLYPLTRWDFRTLGRWLAIFGALSVAAGLVLLVNQYIGLSLKLLAGALIVALPVLFGGAQLLKRRGLLWTGRGIELLGGLAVIGLSFTLGLIYSTGSGNWPALLLIDLPILLVLSYVLANGLLLTLVAVVFFVWFGGATGYESGWGAYWFGMNYPLRFLGAAAAIVALGVAHLAVSLPPRYSGFAKIWISAGLFLGEMALWLLAIFGNFGDMDGPWEDPDPTQILFFSVAWGALSAALIGIGSWRQFRLVTGYGATFLIIEAYTLFFDHLAAPLGPIASLLVAGGGSLLLVLGLENWRRQRKAAKGPASTLVLPDPTPQSQTPETPDN